MCRVRDEISDLSEKYSAALSEHETSGAVVQVQLSPFCVDLAC